MKKTMIIIILAVYIASIAIINFFGLEIKIFDGITYVNSIVCESVTVQNENPVTVYPMNDNGILVFYFDFISAPKDKPYTEDDESIVSNPNVIKINYEVLPHTADDTGVQFEFDENAMAGAIVFHELSRTFVFLKPWYELPITIRSIDGSNKSIQVRIMGIPEDN